MKDKNKKLVIIILIALVLLYGPKKEGKKGATPTSPLTGDGYLYGGSTWRGTTSELTFYPDTTSYIALKFDLGGVPANCEVSSAELSMYLYGTYISGQYDEAWIQIHELYDSFTWSEASSPIAVEGTDYNPSYITRDYINRDSADIWLYFDVASAVQNAVDNGYDEVNFYVKSTTKAGSFSGEWIRFFSREYSSGAYKSALNMECADQNVKFRTTNLLYSSGALGFTESCGANLAQYGYEARYSDSGTCDTDANFGSLIMQNLPVDANYNTHAGGSTGNLKLYWDSSDPNEIWVCEDDLDGSGLIKSRYDINDPDNWGVDPSSASMSPSYESACTGGSCACSSSDGGCCTDSCNYDSAGTLCNTLDCDYLNTDCRDYQDRYSSCSGTSAVCPTYTCTIWDNINEGGTCDGGAGTCQSGDCITASCECSTADGGCCSDNCNYDPLMTQCNFLDCSHLNTDCRDYYDRVSSCSGDSAVCPTFTCGLYQEINEGGTCDGGTGTCQSGDCIGGGCPTDWNDFIACANGWVTCT